MTASHLPLVVSIGEPAGIGPDIALLSWYARKALDLPCFYVRGDAGLLEARAKRLGIRVPVASAEPETAHETFRSALPVVQMGEEIPDAPGQPSVGSAATVVGAIDQGVLDIRDGRAAAIVTLPIHKKALYDAGFTHPGHTEYLAELAGSHWEMPAPHAVMMIAGPELMVVPVTIHIPYKDVPAALSEELIIETARITDKDLRDRFGISSPRLALCGLNPHAGEGGAMGREDLDVIAPAIEKLRNKGIDATGPHPADTLFHARARKNYDCALGMYHDQVLVPAKTLAFDESVNVTLGLPYVRTSPDHGTAFDLAGTGDAKPDSFAAALRMAAVLSDPSFL